MSFPASRDDVPGALRDNTADHGIKDHVRSPNHDRCDDRRDAVGTMVNRSRSEMVMRKERPAT